MATCHQFYSLIENAQRNYPLKHWIIRLSGDPRGDHKTGGAPITNHRETGETGARITSLNL